MTRSTTKSRKMQWPCRPWCVGAGETEKNENNLNGTLSIVQWAKQTHHNMPHGVQTYSTKFEISVCKSSFMVCAKKKSSKIGFFWYRATHGSTKALHSVHGLPQETVGMEGAVCTCTVGANFWTTWGPYCSLSGNGSTSFPETCGPRYSPFLPTPARLSGSSHPQEKMHGLCVCVWHRVDPKVPTLWGTICSGHPHSWRPLLSHWRGGGVGTKPCNLDALLAVGGVN